MAEKKNLEVSIRDSIRVLMPNGRVQEMKLETYLAGAVAMAIGTNAPLEALKAQAVASRTYAAHAKRHTEQTADVCTTSHCQKWKRVDPIVAPEVFRAVSETWGTVALHEGELIEAFFFEHCAGKTRDAEEMAMPALPYLRGAECPCGFTEMKGHGVGMCQRGAIVMARQGGSFKDILKHYYRGVEVVQTRGEGSPIAAEETKATKPTAPPKKTRAAPPPKKPVPPARQADEFAALIDALGQAAATATPIAPPEAKPSSPLPPKPRVEPKPEPEPIAQTRAIEPIAPTKEIAQEPAPAQVEEVIHVDTLPGPRVIAGSLLRAGVAVEIEDMRGNKVTVFSGSAPHYGEGGFEAAVEADGYYTVTVDGKIIEVNLRGETVFLRAEPVRSGS